MVPFSLVMFSHLQWNLRTTFSPSVSSLSSSRSLAHEFRKHQDFVYRCCGQSVVCSRGFGDLQLQVQPPTCSRTDAHIDPKGHVGSKKARPWWFVLSAAFSFLFFDYPSITQGHLLWPQVFLTVSQLPSCWDSWGNSIAKKINLNPSSNLGWYKKMCLVSLH